MKTAKLTAQILSVFFKKKLAFFKNNPAATISAGWSGENDSELYVSANGRTFWVYEEASEVVWNPGNFWPYTSREGEDAERFFNNRLRHFVADYYARKGYSHPAVLWAMHNLLYENGEVIGGNADWFITPEPSNDIPHAELYTAELRRRKEQIQFRKEMRDWAEAHGVTNIRKVTYENHAGEHGYIDYNLVDGTYEGYEVWCCSSYLFGGNCGCYSHDPGEEVSGEMTRYDFEQARKAYWEQTNAVA